VRATPIVPKEATLPLDDGPNIAMQKRPVRTPRLIRRWQVSKIVLASTLTLCLFLYCFLLLKLEKVSTPGKKNPISAGNALAPANQFKEKKKGTSGKPFRRKRPGKQILNAAKEKSSVDYMACCGLGHRISRLSEANYLAKLLNFGLRSFWGYCDTTGVFHYLFGPQPVEELVNVTDTHRSARVNNDVPGFTKLIRKGSEEECNCSFDKVEEDVRFYQSMRKRFRLKDRVEAFRQKHFLNKNVTVVGMHIRAGNGEVGDFSKRRRGIGNEDEWLQNVVQQLVRANWGPSVLFVATDTPPMIDKLRTLMNGTMTVVSFDQHRAQHGTGVLFGERGKVVINGEQCLEGWENSLMDMILLSHADVVVAARPSSFSQSMPMSLVLATSKDSRKVMHPYCELNPTVTEMRCYEDFREWCCIGTTSFSLEGIHQRTDYLRMPPETVDEKKLKVMQRDDGGCFPRPEGWKQTCLPYDWLHPR
jgi:hypothetical protein